MYVVAVFLIGNVLEIPIYTLKRISPKIVVYHFLTPSLFLFSCLIDLWLYEITTTTFISMQQLVITQQQLSALLSLFFVSFCFGQ